LATCIFCGIIAGEIQGKVLFQDESVAAIEDVNPQAPLHLLIVPLRHIETLLDLNDLDVELMGHICSVATRLAREHGVAEQGFRLVANCGAAAGQSVFHIHFHLLGGRPMKWPPG
jgi:histidine triad (HIT) family protein